MSRIRKERPSMGTISEDQQLWNSIRTQLRSLEKMQTSTAGDLLALDQRRKRFVSGDGKPDEIESDELKSAYQKLEGDYQQEQREIAKVLESVEVLIGVRAGDDGAAAGADAASRRKKRRIEGADSMSPTTDRAYSPTSIDLDATTNDARGSERKHRGSVVKGNHAISASATTSGSTANARRMTASSSSSFSGSGGKDAAQQQNDLSSALAKDGSHVDPARARRETLAHQLPLKKGRKVAFRQPSKNKMGPGAANVAVSSSGRAITSSASFNGGSSAASADIMTATDEDGETWIMATVIECINNDKNRYVVQDEEDPAMPTYNTTLKAVVPLPDHPRTLPPEDYKAGTHVLGLYPDTSCFYRAIVRGGGPGLGGRSSKKSKKPDELLNAPYHLEFEDDDGAIRDVPASLVVERP